MRRLDAESARAVAQWFAKDPVAAPAAFDIEVGGATVIRTKDEKCYVVLPKDPKREVRLVGARASSDLLDILVKLGPDRRLVMPTPLFTQLADVADPRALQVLHIFSTTNGVEPGSVPPPRPDLDVRQVLFSDLELWHRMPGEALFLSVDYGTPKDMLSKGVAVGAFNGGGLASLATASFGRIYAMVRVYTQPRYRRHGLARHTLAMVVDLVSTRGLRPLLVVPPAVGQQMAGLAGGLGMKHVAEAAMVPRAQLTI